jgi:hypothetical protein
MRNTNFHRAISPQRLNKIKEILLSLALQASIFQSNTIYEFARPCDT